MRVARSLYAGDDEVSRSLLNVSLVVKEICSVRTVPEAVESVKISSGL